MVEFPFQCDRCGFLWVQAWLVGDYAPPKILKAKPHPRLRVPTELCYGQLLLIDRPDVVAAFLLGGDEAVCVLALAWRPQIFTPDAITRSRQPICILAELECSSTGSGRRKP